MTRCLCAALAPCRLYASSAPVAGCSRAGVCVGRRGSRVVLPHSLSATHRHPPCPAGPDQRHDVTGCHVGIQRPKPSRCQPAAAMRVPLGLGSSAARARLRVRRLGLVWGRDGIGFRVGRWSGDLNMSKDDSYWAGLKLHLMCCFRVPGEPTGEK
jgi:hypothetical protein